MPDISMCHGLGCPQKNECYRYLATPNPFYQSYFSSPPYDSDKCDYFWRDGDSFVKKIYDKDKEGGVDNIKKV